jgi:thiamine-phosphate pyrophosphorylase
MAVGFQLYLITDGYDATTTSRVAAALGALDVHGWRGIAAVQLRWKEASTRALAEAAAALVALCHAHGAPLFVNDRVDVALAVGADGVHLPATGLPSTAARLVGGDRLMYGASTHTLAEARAAAQGVDLIVHGPVHAPRSKPKAEEPIGEAALAEVVRAVHVPVFALGGIGPGEARRVAGLGARAACIGAVLGASDAAEGAREMARALR